MAGTQALDASRTPAFTYEPHALVLVTKPGERFYSPTIEDPIPDSDILDAANRGIKQSLMVRKTPKGDVVVAGRQRTKRALVVNHLLGVKTYAGPIKSVKDAIARLKGTDLEARIVEIAGAKFPKGLMLKAFAENSGTDLDAEASGIAEDEIRRGGAGTSTQIRAARARQLIEAGYPLEKVAETMQGVTLAMLRRWAKAAPSSESKAPKKRGKATRPSAKQLEKALAAAEVAHGRGCDAWNVLAWALGKIDTATFSSAYPHLVEPPSDVLARAMNGSADHAEAAE